MSSGPSVTQSGGASDLLAEALRVGVYGVALVLVVLAAWLLWGRRGEDAAESRSERKVRVKWWFGGIDAWAAGLTSPTRHTFAIASLLLGYHMAAWTAPAHVLPFRVPLDLWFVLVGGAVFACVASVWMDRRQRADDPSQTK